MGSVLVTIMKSVKKCQHAVNKCSFTYKKQTDSDIKQIHIDIKQTGIDKIFCGRGSSNQSIYITFYLE